MEVLEFGRLLLWAAAALLAVMALLAVLGILVRDRRPVVAVRTGFYALLALLLGSSACLVYGFLAGAYNNDYIASYSGRDIPTGFKLAGLWAGLDGSLLFWTLILALMAAIAALQHRWSSRHPAGRRMEPYTYLALIGILGFFVAICIHQNPFAEMSLTHRLGMAERFRISHDSHGNLTDGVGLNPQLMNYWFVIHPPCLYLGLVTFSVPFAFAVAALMAGELGDYWIRVTRRWAMVAWMFLTCGIILGGLWAYRQLGWGGYWAWDPVENASFLPWGAATAFLHSIMIQERRDMLKWWNVFLIIFAFFLTIEATYMTRSGEIDSVHAFAGGDIGIWFRYFKWGIAGVGLFLLAYRFWDLRGAHRLESLLSREAAFYINNLVLVTISMAIWILSWWPKNSELYLGAKQTLEPAFYNRLMTPLFMLLILMTAIGPGLGWVKTSVANLRRNFLWPFVASLLVTAVVYVFFFARGHVTNAAEFVGSLHLEHAAGLYPTGIFIFLSFLILSTVAAEFLRGVRARIKFRKEDVGAAFFNLLRRDNRRYGGYIVHIGIAVLTLGIVVSSMFKVEKKITVGVGESARIGPYTITPVKANRSFLELVTAIDDLQKGRRTIAEIEPGHNYVRDEVVFEVRRVSGALPEAHGASEDGAEPAGELVCELRPERRFYPRQNMGKGQWINEVSIHRRLLGDIYIYYAWRDQNDKLLLEAFLNPLMLLIWSGWFIMIFGSLLALVPMSGNRVGLAE